MMALCNMVHHVYSYSIYHIFGYVYVCMSSVFVQYNNLTHIKITSRLRYLQLLIFHADNSLYSEYGEIYCGAPSQ